MITTICVCGAGTMGSGIAQLCAQSGINTVLYDLHQPMLDKAKASIETTLDKAVAKSVLSLEERAAVTDRIQFTTDLNDCVTEVVIEAIVENIPAKVALFNQLAEVNHSEVIFATNTSSLSVTEIAKSVMHPSRVAGLHFFNPAPVMKLVEVVEAKDTLPSVTIQLLELARQLGKTAVLCKDAPGFIVNHVARPYYLEALYLLEKGLAEVETIDSLLEASGFKLGPFKLMDLIGNDINYLVSESVYKALGEPMRLNPSALQKSKVLAGELGRKTKKGYYNYPA